MNDAFWNGCSRFFEWVLRLAYLNMLWVGFSLGGLIIFGLAPATVAMFAVIRQWELGRRDIPVFETFFETFKKEWGKSSILGLILLLITLLLYFDFKMAVFYFGDQLAVLSLLVSLFIIYGIILLYICPIYVHYDLKQMEVLKYSFIIGFSQPLVSVMMVLSVSGVVLLSLFHFIFLALFSGSVLSFILTKLAFRAFHMDDHRREKGKEQAFSMRLK
ncbi:DUF624 domain-containing protein [Bacillus sp. CLL-7-23]|uniref:DUF624 domain-containing protein n=1 Tax=Bacillus changyiensis TaxID=3004103 RepID=A0ABT4X1J3_9BACI|nr:DUF624 domain-containing protein [Bacillus changyiensis]MDA7026164.1 DUF624 domain-containing protein [Bacillus changyiensis]